MALREEVEKQVEELLQAGKIRPSNSEYAHPIVCVPKSDGTVRLCTDLRQVNEGTICDEYPLPNPDDLLNVISGAKFISTLDCTSGYWQIPIHQDDIRKTAFVTHSGHYEWVVMPFGLKTAGNTFQKVIDNILQPHSKYAKAYIDDTCVYSNEFDAHLEHLRGVFMSCRNSNMSLKLSKCTFASSSVKFVGHEIGSGKRRPLENKVACIHSIPEPYNKKTLRSFLGFCNFYRSYIRDFAKIALPLTDLTKSTASSKFTLNDAQRSAFIRLKQAISAMPSLATPDYSKPFTIHTDASDRCVAAYLSQYAEDGSENFIQFVSCKLTDTQVRWSTIEKEAFAIIYALKKFDILVYGRKIYLFSDHNPLSYLKHNISTSAKLTRWALSLSRYNICLNHIKGPQNVVADYLSRYLTM